MIFVGVLILDTQEAISSESSDMSIIKPKDVSCTSALQKEMTLNEVLGKMRSPLFSMFSVDDNYNKVSTIKVLLDEIPLLRETLRDFAREIHYKRSRNIDENNHYGMTLRESILQFIQKLLEKVIGLDHLTAILTDSSLYLSTSQVHVLTYHIKPLEQFIHRFGEISPFESFIYTNIINGATEYLSNLGDVGEFNFERYIAQEYKGPWNSELSDILKSTEQREYLFQQYQLLRKYPNRFTETTRRTQNNDSVETEQKLREQGYSEDVIRGLDHANDSLNLAQSLRTRSIDPVSTHIPEFADLIDEYIAFIRKEITESQKFSDSDKVERLELLDALQSKAQAYKDSGQVTYFRWLYLNLHLSMIVTPDSYLLNNKELYAFMLIEEGDNVDFESFKEWVINDDGSNFLKIADIISLNEQFRKYKNYNRGNEDVINDIVQRLGLNLTLRDIKELDLEDDESLFMKRLARRLNLNLHDFDIGFNKSEKDFVNFIYLLNHFPERIMLPTIHDLGFISITRTHNKGVHLIGLNGRRDPFAFFLHDLEHSGTRNISSPQIVDPFQSQLESFPRPFKELIEELYLAFTHETGEKITPGLIMEDMNNYGAFVETEESVERYKQEQTQLLFQLMSRLGYLTESEELELQKIILMLSCLEFFSSYRIVEKYEDMEFTERSIINSSIFIRFALKLYSLYEQEQRLLDTLDSH